MASQRHRGPDHDAIAHVSDGEFEVIFGHNRLSILDLSPRGHQPMCDVAGQVSIVHNGEVYNYLELRTELTTRGHGFATGSDTEVIIAAFKEWGTDAFRRFHGMFAFALWDGGRRRLHLVRDRFGVKPLYYWANERQVCFASTARTLGEWLGTTPNVEYLARGVRFGVYDGGEISPRSGIKAVEPGCSLEVTCEDGVLRTGRRRYYDLRERIPETIEDLAGRGTRELVLRVRETLAEAVDIRLRADVPLAVSLSGGVDSATVAALARLRSKGSIVAYCFGSEEDRRSEGRLAGECARQLGLEVRFVVPTIEEVRDAYERVIEAQAAPFSSESVIAQYLVYQAARRDGFKVVLGGQGGDEAFMGYPKFHIFHLQELLRAWKFGKALGSTLDLTGRMFADAPRTGLRWRQRHRYSRRSGMGSMLRLPPVDAVRLSHDANETLWTRQVRDITEVSLPTLLRYEDANSMAHSIESRLPFMDHRVIELGVALPVTLKIRNGYGKWILREAVEGIVPDSIRWTRFKRGFDVSQGWILGGLGETIRRELWRTEDRFKDWMMPGAVIDEAFSDRALCSRGSAFAEATTLSWLARFPGIGREEDGRTVVGARLS